MPGAEERGEQALAADDKKPPFEGAVNGMYLWQTPPFEDSAVWDKRACTDGNQMHDLTEEEAAGSPYYFDVPPYLPPGAWAESPTTVGACKTGDIVFVGRGFDFKPYVAWVTISRDIGRWSVRVIPHASADRVMAITIGGKPAVQIIPVTEEGYGPSAIYVREDWGVSKYNARNLPVDELRRIVEGME